MIQTKKRIFAAAAWITALLLTVPALPSCDGGKIEIINTDYTYSFVIDDVMEGEAPECTLTLVGGAKEETFVVNYKIDEDATLKLSVDGAQLSSGGTVTFGLTGKVHLTLPVLSPGQHVLHLQVTNQYGKSVAQDITFSVIHVVINATGVDAPQALSLLNGTAVDTTVSVVPATADDLALEVTSADPKVATAALTGDGAQKKLHVEALAVGSTTLNIRHADIEGGVNIPVSVYEYVIAHQEDLSIVKGSSTTVTMTVEPNTDITLTSSSPCVTVTPTGSNTFSLYAATAGTATLTAKAGPSETTFRVTVSETIAVSPMSVSIAPGAEKTINVVSTSAWTATFDEETYLTVTERGDGFLKIKSKNTTYEEHKAVLTVTNDVDRSVKAVCDILLEKNIETLSLSVSSTKPGETVVSVTGTNDGWEVVAAPQGVTRKDGTSSITLTNSGFSDISGTLTLQTKKQQVQASVDVTVAARELVLEALTISPSSFSVEAGQAFSLSVTARYNDGRTPDVTDEVTFATSTNLQRSANVFTGLSEGSAWVRATYGGKSAEASGTVYLALKKLLVEPTYFSALVGESRAFSATAVLSQGVTRDVTKEATWTVAGPASQVSAGYYKMNDVGDVIIDAEYEYSGKKESGRSVGTVTKPSGVVTGVEINPKTATVETGQSVSFTGTVRYSDGTTDNSGSFTASPSSVLAGSDGNYVALSEGTATVTYTYSGYSASATVTVTGNGGGGGGGGGGGDTPKLVGVSLNRTSLTLYTGRSANITAVANYSDGSAKSITTSCDWVSSNDNVATVSYGTVTGVKAGNATVTATYSGMSASCAVVIEEEVVLSSVSVTPSSLSFKTGDAARSVSAKAYYSDGKSKDVTNLGSWSSSNSAVAKVSAGTVSPIGAGSATVSCSYGGKTGSCSVSVSAPDVYITSFTMSQTEATLSVGETLQLDATIRWSDGKGGTYNNAYTWTSSNSGVASVSRSGLVSAVKEGTTTITASFDGAKCTCSVTVSAAKTISLSSTSLTWDATSYGSGAAKEVTVTSDVAWSMSGLNTSYWYASTTSGSKGTTKVTFYPTSANTSTSSARGCTVTFSGSGVASKTLGLTQNKAAHYLRATPTSLTWTATEYGSSSQKEVYVTSDISWKVSVPTGWTCSTQSGSGNSALYIYPTSENTASSARSATAVISPSSSSSGVSDVRISLSQAGAGNYINVSATALSWDATSTAGQTFTVSSNVNWSASLSDGSNWSISPASGSSGSTTVTVAPKSKNTNTSAERKCQVTISGGSVTKKVDLTQGKAAAPYLTVSPTSLSWTSSQSGSSVAQNVTVSSNIAWSLSVPSGFTSNKTSGTGNATVSLYPSAANTAAATKTGTATFSGSGVSNVGVSLSQAGVSSIPVTGVSLNKTSLSMKPGDTETLSATVSPSNASNKSISWSSNNTSVATVSNGKVTAVGEGSARITVTTADGGFTASCNVTVTPTTYSISLDKSYMNWTSSQTHGQTVTVTTTNVSSWNAEITEGSSYFSVSRSGNVLTVTPNSQNSGTSERTGKLTVSDAAGHASSKTVSLTQSGQAPVYDITITPNGHTWNWSAKETATKTATVTLTNVTTVDVSLTDATNWSASLSGSTLSVQPRSQNTGAERSCVITLSDRAGKASSKSVTARQAAGSSTTTYELVLGGSAVTVNVGGTATVSAAATYYTYVWVNGVKDETQTSSRSVTATLSSNNTSVATVSGTTVTGIKAGSTTLSGTYSGTTSSNTIPVTVNAVSVKSATISPTTASYSGQVQVRFIGIVTLSDNTSYDSSNASQAGYFSWAITPQGQDVHNDGGGWFQISEPGTYTVTYNFNKDGITTSKSHTFTVTSSTVNVTGVSLNKTSVELSKGQKQQLVATVTPSNATDKRVNWTTSNSGSVTVDGNGNIEAITVGEATITARTVDGGFTATCKVTVKGNDTRVTSASIYPNDTAYDTGQLQQHFIGIVTLSDGRTFDSSKASDQACFTWECYPNNSLVHNDGEGWFQFDGPGTYTVTYHFNKDGITASKSVTFVLT